jgi:5-methylcytosine-specific restriction endonuclease McrA
MGAGGKAFNWPSVHIKRRAVEDLEHVRLRPRETYWQATRFIHRQHKQHDAGYIWGPPHQQTRSVLVQQECCQLQATL